MSHFLHRGAAAIGAAASTCAMLVVLLPGPARAVAQESLESARGARTDRMTQKIARGRYLVRITGCNDCHTPRYTDTAGHVKESQWLTGNTLGFQGPWGTTYPANLRQLMQSLSAQEWVQHARRPTRPPMPWFSLRDMSGEDLEAMYAFVRSLGPSDAKVPAYAPPGTRVATPVVVFGAEPRSQRGAHDR